MVRPERQQIVLDILRDFRGLDPLKNLVWSELNYHRINQPISRHGWSGTASDALAEDPLLFAGGGQDNSFHVIYARLASDRLLLGQERPVVSRLLRDHPYALFVFSNQAQDRWHFINVKYDEKGRKRRLFRRITIGPEERLRTASERLALLDLASVSPDLFGLSPLAIQARHDEAFDVESVTKQFFEEYKAVFGILQDELSRQTKAREWAHDYALQFLNRCMFLYFVQRKRWLGSDTEFLRTFWEAYQESRQPKDSFFEQWLKVLFFEAFNNKFHGGHRHFPDPIKEALAVAPFLNGGLFKENELDTKYDFKLPDNRFLQVFTFLERYNFTITEDSPLDQEVAVDPEMIGKVYESLVNVSTEADERGDAGIFYTPRTEIDLMCRLALVDNLANNLGEDHKKLFYEAVFAFESDEKALADKVLTEANLWPALADHLREIAVVDPACGSGSFLVGMLHILDDLLARANAQLGIEEAPYDRRKRIIGQSLYGVDVMDWAVHVAELRLWLALIVDAEFTPSQLHIRKEPLLPHFTFKIRCGDSLVQEVGGINLGHIRGSHQISPALKKRVTELKAEKLRFYNNDPACRYRSVEQLEHEERRLFRDLLQERHTRLQEEIKSLRRKIEGPRERQVRLDGTEEATSHQMKLEAAQWKKELETLNAELERLAHAREALKKDAHVPFVWDIAFVEVFEGEKGGFDVVIGNPPYVRHENISDPRLPREKVTTENKKAYKAKLACSVYQAFPDFFHYRPEEDRAGRKLDAKSDLYIYFYFHGLSLLNPGGSFCFITSNSWLDVGYGAELQEFLLRHSQIRMVLENQIRRSFASADVNTVIVLLAAPDEHREWGLEKPARFVMLTAPFEQILSPVIFEEIESAGGRTTKPEYRIYPISQDALLVEGFGPRTDVHDADAPEDALRKRPSSLLVKASQYSGGKWGGKYLRAPEIYFTVLEKGRKFIQTLDTYFEGERYLNTGGADGFFILTDVKRESKGVSVISNEQSIRPCGRAFHGEIENEYLIPLIKDYTKTDKRLEIRGYDAYCLVVRGRPSARLQRYIAWGEEQGYHQRSVTKHQTPWYKPTNQMLSAAKILVPRSFSDSFTIYYNPREYLSLRFYRLHAKADQVLLLAGYLNTSLVALFLETLGNKSLGQGVLDFFMADFLAMRIPVVLDREIETAFKKLKERPTKPVGDEYGAKVSSGHPTRHFSPLDDRKELDDVIFDALKLSRGERDAIYEAVVNQVEARLQKATSLEKKLKRKRVMAADATRGIWAELADTYEEELEN